MCVNKIQKNKMIRYAFLLMYYNALKYNVLLCFKIL